MNFDLYTLNAATAVVVIASGITFLLAMVFRAPTPSSRLWSVSFLAAILSGYCNLVASLDLPSEWIAVAVGNTSLVLSTGFLWLGCARFNELNRTRGWVFAGVAGSVAAVSLLSGPAGSNLSAVVASAAMVVLGTMGLIESRRGVLGQQQVALIITAAFAVTAVSFAAQGAILLVDGPESQMLITGAALPAKALITMALSIGTVVGLSVLRATEASLRGRGGAATLGLSGEGLFDPHSFQAVLGRAVRRAEQEGASLAVVAMRMDDLPRIATAFGVQEVAELVRRWRVTVQEAAPLWSVVGEEGPYGVLVALPADSETQVRTVAARLQQRVSDALVAGGASVIPEVSVGIAITGPLGTDAATLIDAANDAARRSGSVPGARIVMAD